jgi:Ca2+-dependent lipid-binding protein
LTNAGLACFEFLTVSFVTEPKINFSLKLSSLDVMNLGFSKDYNVTAIVEQLLKSILSSIMVYPKKIIIPMYPDADLSSIANPTPKGVLIISNLSCRGLKVADMNGLCDPYIRIKLSHSEQTTKVIYKTLNPSWDDNDSFEFLVANKEIEVLKFELYDHDDFSADDNIGYCEVPLNLALESASSQNLQIYDDQKLNSLGTGTLQFTARYVVLMSPDDQDLLSKEELATRRMDFDTIDEDYDMQLSKLGHSSIIGLPNFEMIKVGLLTISNIQCENLKPKTKSSVLSSTPKPIRAYASVEVYINGLHFLLTYNTQ